MELPKNIKQIGETNNSCKIYVEDYVVSYIKQLNPLAQDKEMAVALYGHRKEEGGVAYLFLYGAAKLDFLNRETRHLSQAQKQEIDRLRKRYFTEYDFLGYRLLNGEMVDGFHICEQDICRYINGYVQFYEKNDSMLAYMLEVRKEEIQPEVVEQEKYEAVKKRQEERRATEAENVKEYRFAEDRRETSERNNGYREKNMVQYRKKQEREQQGVGTMSNFRRLKVSVVAMFAILGVLGMVTLTSEEGPENLQMAARQLVEGIKEQKLPDAMEVMNQEVQSDTVTTQDKLTEALEEENQMVPTQTPVEEVLVTPTPSPTTEPTPTPAPTPTATPVIEETTTVAESASVQYTIKEGDTLIGISLKNYGNKNIVQDICALNEITDPDDIKVGQKILLP